MLFHFKGVFDLEKKSVFLINFFLILLVILSFHYDVSLKYFFYFDIIFTLIVSYFFFKRSKKLSKTLIITNLFIFFYFLYPYFASFMTQLLGVQSYIFIIFYNVLIAYIFLLFSGYHKDFLGNISKFNFSLFFLILLVGFAFGLMFNIVKEPVPDVLMNFNDGIGSMIGFFIFSSLIFAISEQVIFSGFLFNIYRKLTSTYDAFYQTAIIFVLFHILRFEELVKYYFVNFNDFYILFILAYYILLFIFMICALYLYSFKSKEYEGNFFYPVVLHFAADFSLMLFYLVRFII